MDWNLVLNIILASTALIASIASPYISLKINRENIKSNVALNHHRLWLNDFQNYVAEIISEANSMVMLSAMLQNHISETTKKEIQERYRLAFDCVTKSANKLGLILDIENKEENEVMKSVKLFTTTVFEYSSKGIYVPNKINELTEDIYQKSFIITKNRYRYFKEVTN